VTRKPIDASLLSVNSSYELPRWKFSTAGTIRAVRVYYEDTDFSGIVYHASYLRFMERGRTDYLRRIGADHRALFEQAEKEAPGFSFVVRHMSIDFRKLRVHG
jgi:acyl-CoA thioesterase FadM